MDKNKNVILTKTRNNAMYDKFIIKYQNSIYQNQSGAMKNSIIGKKNGKIVSPDTKACLEHISIRTLNISSCFGYCKTMSDLYDRKKVKYDN